MTRYYRRQQWETPIQTQETTIPRVQGFLVGLFLGGMVGAVTMLLLAPRSGKKTRSRIEHQFDDLREQIGEGVENVEEEVLDETHRLAANVRGKVKEFKRRGQAMFDGK